MYAEEDKDDDAIEEAEDVEDDGDVRHEEEEGFEYEEEERAQMRGLHAESGVEESRRLQDDDAEQDDETEQDAGADNEEDEEDYDEDNKNDGDRDEGECAGSIYWKALPNHVDIVPRMDLGSPVADTEGDYASYIQRWVRRLETSQSTFGEGLGRRSICVVRPCPICASNPNLSPADVYYSCEGLNKLDIHIRIHHLDEKDFKYTICASNPDLSVSEVFNSRGLDCHMLNHHDEDKSGYTCDICANNPHLRSEEVLKCGGPGGIATHLKSHVSSVEPMDPLNSGKVRHHCPICATNPDISLEETVRAQDSLKLNSHVLRYHIVKVVKKSYTAIFVPTIQISGPKQFSDAKEPGVWQLISILLMCHHHSKESRTVRATGETEPHNCFTCANNPNSEPADIFVHRSII